MAKSKSMPRRVTEYMAQFLKQPTKKQLVKATLPFNIKDASPKIANAVITRTRQRWDWFTKAHELDTLLGTSLGTLAYLPSEIRQEIFRWLQRLHYPTATNHWRLERAQGMGWAYDCGGGVRSGAITIALNFQFPDPSASLRDEFNAFFFHHNTICFHCPSTALDYLDYLSRTQRSQMRRVAITLFDCYCHRENGRLGYKEIESDWSRVCSSLSTYMTSIQFILVDYPGSDPDSLRDGRRTRLSRSLLEVLTKVCKRRAPRVFIDVKEECTQRKPSAQNREAFTAILNELE